MIKIKLQESRTLPVSRELVSALEGIYKKAFLKLVEVYILDELENSDLKGRSFYNQLLKLLYQEFPDIQGVKIPIDKNYLYSLIQNMGSADKTERGIQITEIPVDKILNVLTKDKSNPLKKFVGQKITLQDAEQRIREYFQDRGVESLGIYIELQKTAEKRSKEEETYSGLYIADIGVITIAFEAAFFAGSIIINREGRRIRISPRLGVESGKRPETIIDYLKDELRELPVSIRHELQHFYQSLFSKVFGKKDFTVGLPPQQVLRRSKAQASGEEQPHHMIPVEMQTDIQDEIDKFHMDLNSFKSNNKTLFKRQPEIGKALIKIMLKIFSNSSLSEQEKSLASKYKLNLYITDASATFRDIKSSDRGGELYKYALKTLYSSVGDLLEERIMADKINIVLKENAELLSEELSKEEIRKIVRDELEKMLGNKETKKEIAKITKQFMKKFYRELSIDSTYVIDRIDV
jgi:hypothetical protein